MIVSPRNDVWETSAYAFASTNQKYYPDLGGDTPTVWNFYISFPDVLSYVKQDGVAECWLISQAMKFNKCKASFCSCHKYRHFVQRSVFRRQCRQKWHHFSHFELNIFFELEQYFFDRKSKGKLHFVTNRVFLTAFSRLLPYLLESLLSYPMTNSAVPSWGKMIGLVQQIPRDRLKKPVPLIDNKRMLLKRREGEKGMGNAGEKEKWEQTLT